MTVTLRQQCHTQLSGNKESKPADEFLKMAEWCRDNNIHHDVYGEGALIQKFEQEVADLLGYEAGLFVMTGTMTQPTLLEMVCEEKKNNIVAMHETCHIYRHERQGYQLQNRFNVLPVGNVFRTWNVEDLKAWPDKIAAAVYELPMREIGGQLPLWSELERIKQHCKEEQIHLHMDGARVWECAAYYGKSYQEIAKGFESAYVSLYKGINGLGGSMLLGSKAMIAKADVWMKRQGGNVYHKTPYIVSAAMQFDERIKAMPSLFERTKSIYELINSYSQFTVNPSEPNANMLHLYLPLSHEKASLMRDRLAREKGVWLGNPQYTPLKNQVQIEWYIGDTLLAMSDEELKHILDWVAERIEFSST